MRNGTLKLTWESGKEEVGVCRKAQGNKVSSALSNLGQDRLTLRDGVVEGPLALLDEDLLVVVGGCSVGLKGEEVLKVLCSVEGERSVRRSPRRSSSRVNSPIWTDETSPL